MNFTCDDSKLHVANCVVAKGGVLLESFKSNIGIDGAMVFTDADARVNAARINTFVSERTDGQVKGFGGMITCDMAATLLSAVHFKANWLSKFDEAWTKELDFFHWGSTVARGQFMEKTDHMHASLGDEFADGTASAIRLDYEGGDFCGLFVLPSQNTRDHMKAALNSLASRHLKDALSAMQLQRVKLQLPRFDTGDVTAIMNDVLRSMGMKRAFDDAELSRMCEDQLKLQAVLQVGRMQVDESGTTAAGAAAAVCHYRGIAPPPPELRFDRPFLAMVVHIATGAPVFMARVDGAAVERASGLSSGANDLPSAYPATSLGVAENHSEDEDEDSTPSKRRRVIDVDEKNADGLTPAFLTLMKGNSEILEMLISNGANPNATGANGASMVFVAVSMGFTNCLEVLIDADADVNAPNADGLSPSMVAIVKGDDESLKMLMDAGASAVQDSARRLSPSQLQTLKDISGGVCASSTRDQ